MKKKKLEPVSLGIGLDGFVPVAGDHWWSDLLDKSMKNRHPICGVITLEENEEESHESTISCEEKYEN